MNVSTISVSYSLWAGMDIKWGARMSKSRPT